MPRRATIKQSDEEESKPGKKTRNSLLEKVESSPLRRSARTRQSKQNDESPDSSYSDTSSQGRRPSRTLRARNNSNSSDLTDITEITPPPPKRVTRRSSVGITSVEVAKKAITRSTRACSESKSPVPTRVTRRSRANSVGLENIKEFQSPSKVQRRKSVLHPELVLEEGNEDEGSLIIKSEIIEEVDINDEPSSTELQQETIPPSLETNNFELTKNSSNTISNEEISKIILDQDVKSNSSILNASISPNNKENKNDNIIEIEEKSTPINLKHILNQISHPIVRIQRLETSNILSENKKNQEVNDDVIIDKNKLDNLENSVSIDNVNKEVSIIEYCSQLKSNSPERPSPVLKNDFENLTNTKSVASTKFDKSTADSDEEEIDGFSFKNILAGEEYEIEEKTETNKDNIHENIESEVHKEEPKNKHDTSAVKSANDKLLVDESQKESECKLDLSFRTELQLLEASVSTTPQSSDKKSISQCSSNSSCDTVIMLSTKSSNTANSESNQVKNETSSVILSSSKSETSVTKLDQYFEEPMEVDDDFGFNDYTRLSGFQVEPIANSQISNEEETKTQIECSLIDNKKSLNNSKILVTEESTSMDINGEENDDQCGLLKSSEEEHCKNDEEIYISKNSYDVGFIDHRKTTNVEETNEPIGKNNDNELDNQNNISVDDVNESSDSSSNKLYVSDISSTIGSIEINEQNRMGSSEENEINGNEESELTNKANNSLHNKNVNPLNNSLNKLNCSNKSSLDDSLADDVFENNENVKINSPQEEKSNSSQNISSFLEVNNLSINKKRESLNTSTNKLNISNQSLKNDQDNSEQSLKMNNSKQNETDTIPGLDSPTQVNTSFRKKNEESINTSADKLNTSIQFSMDNQNENEQDIQIYNSHHDITDKIQEVNSNTEANTSSSNENRTSFGTSSYMLNISNRSSKNDQNNSEQNIKMNHSKQDETDTVQEVDFPIEANTSSSSTNRKSLDNLSNKPNNSKQSLQNSSNNNEQCIQMSVTEDEVNRLNEELGSTAEENLLSNKKKESIDTSSVELNISNQISENFKSCNEQTVKLNDSDEEEIATNRGTKSKTNKKKSLSSSLNKSDTSNSSSMRDTIDKNENDSMKMKNSKGSSTISISQFFFKGSSEDESESKNHSIDSDIRSSEDESESESHSIDSDIRREYNLNGSDISKYSDDDVPGDECRASEEEYSDSDDNGSDLADFVVDDEDSLNEEAELSEDVDDRENEENDEIEEKDQITEELSDDGENIDVITKMLHTKERKLLSIETSTPKSIDKKSVANDTPKEEKKNYQENPQEENKRLFIKESPKKSTLRLSEAQLISELSDKDVRDSKKLDNTLPGTCLSKGKSRMINFNKSAPVTDTSTNETVKSNKTQELNDSCSQVALSDANESKNNKSVMNDGTEKKKKKKKKLAELSNDNVETLLNDKPIVQIETFVPEVTLQGNKKRKHSESDDELQNISTIQKPYQKKQKIENSYLEISSSPQPVGISTESSIPVKSKKQRKLEKTNQKQKNIKVTETVGLDDSVQEVLACTKSKKQCKLEKENKKQKNTKITETVKLDDSVLEVFAPTKSKKQCKLERENQKQKNTKITETVKLDDSVQEVHSPAKSKKQCKLENKGQKQKNIKHSEVKKDDSSVEEQSTLSKTKKKYKQDKEILLSSEIEKSNEILNKATLKQNKKKKTPKQDSTEVSEEPCRVLVTERKNKKMRKENLEIELLPKAKPETEKSKPSEKSSKTVKETPRPNNSEWFVESIGPVSKSNKKGIKRLSDVMLEYPSDVLDRPKKRQKHIRGSEPITTKTQFGFSVESVRKDLVGTSNSTTRFDVIPLKTLKKTVSTKIAAMTFRERMLSRNQRVPISTALMRIQKLKASGRYRE